jgi:hypothetical protein
VKEGKLKLTSPTKPAPAFPNFQNAFLRTSPIRAQVPSTTQKHKSKMIVGSTHAPEPEPELPQNHDIEQIDVEQLETSIPDVEMEGPPTPKAESRAAAPVTPNNYNPWSQRLKGVRDAISFGLVLTYCAR